MPIDVTIFQIKDHHRSQVVCSALLKGIRSSCNDKVRVVRENDYKAPTGEVAIFYGLAGNLHAILHDYPATGRVAIYVDLGYWGRREGGRWSGFHKFAVNSRHPTEYFQRIGHPPDRLASQDVKIRPWKDPGGHILLAGMGDKGALAEGYQPEEWERKTIETLRKHTQRPIIYRPKPSWKTAKKIPGAFYSPHTQELSAVLLGAHAVVTHHSNVAVDGLVEGIPAFCWKGVAFPLASHDLAMIESPIRPAGREYWAADVAYTQFSIAEMERGKPWAHLRREGLIP